MKYFSAKSLLFSILIFTVISCSSDDSYIPIADDSVDISPVILDLETVPYPQLSDYNFFEGAIKNMDPVFGVLPYELGTSLFTDYAKKKRFLWMPENSSAEFDGSENILDFPTGTVLIKSFYYENVLPAHESKIIETRLMIKKETEWIFANYVWNEQQDAAVLDMSGQNIPISWNENGETRNVNYRIPSAAECMVCHKKNDVAYPIGPKPQNLNIEFSYDDVEQNQLQKLIDAGYLTNFPENLEETIKWDDASADYESRARAYLDINCAHCHSTGGHCDYVAIRLNLDELDLYNVGVCMEPISHFDGGPFVINAGNADASEMYLRMSTNAPDAMMPIMGRSVVHEEGVQLIKNWINAMESNCE
ncbi:MAG TPA: hypothetical protein VFM70_09050 [Salinimicrobium sp.]|nr:hypothetical protein [Salinimicrobium sp.]